jgi:hypothetical protein
MLQIGVHWDLGQIVWRAKIGALCLRQVHQPGHSLGQHREGVDAAIWRAIWAIRTGITYVRVLHKTC